MALNADIADANRYFTGEDKSLAFTVYEPGTSQAAAEAGSGTPQNISGWTLSWMVKRFKTDADADALVTKTTGDGIMLTTPASGLCTVTVEDSDIDALQAGATYYHELKRTNAGFETVLSQGLFVLSQAVHR
jgi:hypothetical protein